MSKWFTFLPAAVLGAFTMLLPGTIGVYLIYNRKEPHAASTAAHRFSVQPFKPLYRVCTILTGIIIYLPPTTQAAVAAIVCLVASCS